MELIWVLFLSLSQTSVVGKVYEQPEAGSLTWGKGHPSALKKARMGLRLEMVTVLSHEQVTDQASAIALWGSLYFISLHFPSQLTLYTSPFLYNIFHKRQEWGYWEKS